MYEIKFIPNEELNSILPFLEMLNENTPVDELKLRLEILKNDNNYKCVGIFDNAKLIGISGIWMLYKHYVGKHIEPDNVVIHTDYRGKKVGEKIMEFIHHYAKENGCVASELNCYVRNPRGQKFWIEQGYEILGLHMRKML